MQKVKTVFWLFHQRLLGLMSLILLLSLDITAQTASTEQSNTVQLTLKALNLSEDGNPATSLDDEILLLVYGKDANGADTLLVFIETVMNGTKQEATTTLPFHSEQMTFFLIELDDETPVAEIDKTIKAYQTEIIQEFNSKSYLGLEHYLKDNDLLGYETITFSRSKPHPLIIFKGRHKLDKFEYQLSIKT